MRDRASHRCDAFDACLSRPQLALAATLPPYHFLQLLLDITIFRPLTSHGGTAIKAIHETAIHHVYIIMSTTMDWRCCCRPPGRDTIGHVRDAAIQAHYG